VGKLRLPTIATDRATVGKRTLPTLQKPQSRKAAKPEGRRPEGAKPRSHEVTWTPFQNATRPFTISAFGFGSG
jgi:hypothetical protein